MRPPQTRRDDFREVFHGVEIIDPYRWLEDQESDETRAWIRAQNEYAHAVVDGVPMRKTFQERIESLLRVDQTRWPQQRGSRFFIEKKAAEDELWSVYVREGLDGDDRLLIDPHGLSPDQTTEVDPSDVSSDGRYLVYEIRHAGEDETELHVLDVDTGEDLQDVLPKANYTAVSWRHQRHDGFYYGVHHKSAGPRVYFHRFGDDPAQDEVIFGEGLGPTYWAWPYVSDDGRYLLLGTAEGWQRSQIFVKDLVSDGPIEPIVAGVDAQFYGQFAGDKLVIQTDLDAPNRKVCVVDLLAPAAAPADWQVIVPEASDVIESVSAAGGRVFVRTLHNVDARVRAYAIDGAPLGEVDLPGFGTAIGPWGEWTSDDAFVYFASYTHPSVYFHYRVSTGQMTELAKEPVPFERAAFESYQVWYESTDGTKIPMTIAHRKGLELAGDCAVLMYGYGGFASSLTPFFSATWATWMEHDGVLAVPNIRGGGEFGEDWHRAGMLENKQNVFDDFIAAAEWLQSNDYTRPERTAISGGSNGGLLVGAALTQRPELFQAVLCTFPDLDMLGYSRFVLNPPALLEYGDSRIPEQFEFLVKYSPYQRVTDGTAYPAVLLRTGDGDTRVPPLQARKMAARLQAATSSDRPVVLLYEEKAGHAGGRPLRGIIEDEALELAFVAWQVGLGAN